MQEQDNCESHLSLRRPGEKLHGVEVRTIIFFVQFDVTCIPRVMLPNGSYSCTTRQHFMTQEEKFKRKTTEKIVFLCDGWVESYTISKLGQYSYAFDLTSLLKVTEIPY